MISFVAIDFETANAKRASVCSVGVVKVVDNVIVDAFYSLVDPDTDDWGWMQTQVHGIVHEHVKDSPKFDVVWNDSILPMLEGADYIIGHAVSFEKSVINKSCEKYHLPFLDIEYKCSLKLAQKVYKLSSAKLNRVCDVFGFELLHHHALSDALASARIAINFYKDKDKGEKFGKYELSEEENAIIDMQMSELGTVSSLKKKKAVKNNDNGVTDKQRHLLLSLGAEECEIDTLTRVEASEVIGKLLKDQDRP